MTVATPELLDLDAKRVERARRRSARRAGRGETQTIRFGGQTVATIGAEFPLDVLEPFADVNIDLALLVRQAMDLAAASDTEAQLSTLDMIVSVLAANPQLPREFIGAVKTAAVRLFGEEGYARLVGPREDPADRITPWDIADLVKGLLNWYGVNLGEFSSPSTASTDGGTSKPTSGGSTESTSTEPGESPVIPASLVSAT